MTGDAWRVGVVCGFALLAAAACSGAEGPAGDEGRGVRVFRLADSATATFGAFEGDSSEIFTRVHGARFFSDGRVVVGDFMSAHFRVFDPSGARVATLGSRGEGPGQFQLNPTWGVMGGDTLVVFDNAARRLTYLDAEGGVPATAPIGGSSSVQIGGESYGTSPVRGWVLATGDIAVEPAVFTGSLAYGSDGIRSDTLPVLVYGRDGREAATLGPVLAYERHVLDRSVAFRPFGARLQVAAVGDRVAVGNGLEPRVSLWDARGSRVGDVDLPIEPLAVTDGAVRARRDRWLRMTRGDGGPIFDAAPPPDTAPYHEALLGDSEGRLWIRRYDLEGEGPAEWLALDEDLRPWARVTVPARYELADAKGSAVLLIETDELDRQRVVAVPLRDAPASVPPPPPS